MTNNFKLQFSKWTEIENVVQNEDSDKPNYKTDSSFGRFFNTEKGLRIELDKSEYSFVRALCRADNVKSNFYYKIDAEILSSGIDFDIIYSWKDKDNRVSLRGYTKPGETILSPDNGVSLEIIVIAYGTNCEGYVEILNLVVTEVGEYKEKKTVLSSVALPFRDEKGNINKRTMEQNVSEICARIDEIALNKKPDLVVLTECVFDRMTGLEEEGKLTFESEELKRVREKAKEYSTYVVLSMRVRRDNDKYANAGVLIGRNGEIEGHYYKTHITMSERESGMIPGDGVKVFDTDIGKIGIAICWDFFFPDVSKKLIEMGADIICHPTAGYDEVRAVQRAKESGAFVIVSAVDYYSQSVIIDPNGNKLSSADQNNGYAIAEIDIKKPFYTYWLGYPSNAEAKNIYRYETAN